jgi:multicomponent Na+:H+ antiporter subunit C
MAAYLILALFLLGLWGLLWKSNLIKKVISLGLINSALVILFVYLGSLSGSTAPIMLPGSEQPVVDPLPQALTLTMIVIGICLTALALVLVARIYRHRGTLDIHRLEHRGAEPRDGTGADGPGYGGGDGDGDPRPPAAGEKKDRPG